MLKGSAWALTPVPRLILADNGQAILFQILREHRAFDDSDSVHVRFYNVHGYIAVLVDTGMMLQRAPYHCQLSDTLGHLWPLCRHSPMM